MKIEIKRDELLKGLGLVQGIVERRNTMPILSHVLIQAEKSICMLFATDLEVGINVSCPAQVAEKGKAAVPGRKLYEIVKELPSGMSVQINEEKNFWIEIQCMKSKFRISGLDPADFPTFPSFEGEEYGLIDGESFHDMIEKTIYAVSQDELRKNLNGVYIEPIDNNIRMVGTDGHRLVYVDKKGTIGGLGKKGPLVSRKGILEIKKIIEEGEKEAQLALTEKSLLMKGETVSFFTRLVEGEFPEYGAIIPKEGKKKITVKRNELLTSLRRVAVIAGGKSPAVKVSLAKGVIRISSINPEVGEAQDEVPAEYEGEDLALGINARYLIEPLSVLEEDDILIELSDESSPLLLRKKEGKDYISVIMPMKLD